ncbi:MAG: AMP-binding protein, partial [Proteobacteria bacterium]|nr:AMP-binding protein [Pseudomonadota bacterium]
MIGAVIDVEALRRSTAPALLVERARRAPDAVAFRAKQRGRYRERTWRDYAGLVARAALALQALGLQRGERLAIMGDPCEEWMIVDLAAQALGAITYGIYPTAAVSEVAYQMRDGGAAIFVAETQEYVDKILPIADELAGLRAIVVIDGSAMFNYDHAKLRRLNDLLAAVPDAGSLLDALAALTAALDPRDPAFIVYTSGTTG